MNVKPKNLTTAETFPKNLLALSLKAGKSGLEEPLKQNTPRTAAAKLSDFIQRLCQYRQFRKGSKKFSPRNERPELDFCLTLFR
jgi:hypothetical protein